MSSRDFGKRTFRQNAIAYLDANPDENDVTFLVGPDEEEVEALQFSLKASCPAFDKLFKEKWGTERLKDKRRIPLPELDPTSFRIFLQAILCDEWSSEAFERMDLKPDTISHLIHLSYQLDMPELHKIFYSLRNRFPSLATNPAPASQTPNLDKSESPGDKVMLLLQRFEKGKSRKHTLANKNQKLPGDNTTQTVSYNKPSCSHTVGTTEFSHPFSNDNDSKSVQQSHVTTGMHVGGSVTSGGHIITVMNTLAQKQAAPVTTFHPIDSPIPSFTGRQRLLESIHSKMQECSSQTTFLDRIIVLCGLGGIGKTELARMYAQKNINDPIIQNVAWIVAETPKTIKSSFDPLAKTLELPPNENIVETVKLVYTHFSDHVKTGLFIFDNAPQFNEKMFGIYKFLPAQNLEHKPLILVTSRETDWKIPKKNIIHVENFDDAESFELVVKILQPSFNYNSHANNSAINKLVQAFQGFPLGISLAACNIRCRDETEFKQQIENYVKRMNVPLGGWAKDEQNNLATRYKLIMENVWDMSIEKIEMRGEEGRVAIELLNFMAYFPTDGITVQLMSHLYNFMYGQIVTKKSFLILEDKSMASVAKLSESLNLFKSDHPSAVERIRIHKLVQHITREQLDAKQDYLYLSQACDYLANMKLLGNDNYSDDAVLCLHEHLKVRKWPQDFIRYSVVFCSFMTFMELQNLKILFAITKDVHKFLGIQNMKIDQLQADERTVNLFALCCLWINISFEKSVEQNFVELFQDSKLSKQNFETLFRSLKAPLPKAKNLTSKMDLPFLHEYLYNFSHQHIHRFLASKMMALQHTIANATSDAVLEYEALMRQVVHEDQFTSNEIFERHLKIAEKHAMDKFYFLCKSATDHDLEVHTYNLLQLIQTKLRQFQDHNEQTKAHVEDIIAQEIVTCLEVYTNAMNKVIKNQNPSDYNVNQLHAESSALVTRDFLKKHSESPLLIASLQRLSNQLNEKRDILLQAAKLKLEENVQRADRCFLEAVDYYRRQMVKCKKFHQFHLSHNPAKQRAVQRFQNSKSIPDELLAERLVSLRAEITSIRIKTLCSLDTKLSTSLADLRIPRTPTSTSSASVAFGIDFGTTSCSVAILRHPDQMPEVLKNDFGQNETPSYVSYVMDEEEGRDGELHVFAGNTARELEAENPEFTVFDIKRLIGRSFHDPRIQKYKQLRPLQLVDVQGFVGVKCHRKTLHPQAIATNLISHLKKAAEEALGVTVNSAVVTVPVYFTDVHKQLTKDACVEAGIQNIQFIADPEAVAVAYGLRTILERNETKNCLIYDLGGGTFKVSVFRLDVRRNVSVRATGGDDCLGGQDFTDLITEFCIDEFKKLYGVDLAEVKSSDDAEVCKKAAQTLHRIRDECEVQKCNLASLQSVVVSLENIYKELHLLVTVTQSIFEGLIDALLKQSVDILKETVEKSGLGKGEIDDVILIGGSTRIPKVQQMVQEYFGGKQIRRTINADEAVACGAAVHAYNVFKENAAPFSVVTLLEETQLRSHSLESASSLQLSAAATLPKTIRWGKKINGFPRRGHHAAVAVGSEIYSFGGQGSYSDPSYSIDVLDVFVLNVNDREKEWKQLPIEKPFLSLFSSTPNLRRGHSAVAHKEFVIIFGGWDKKKLEALNSTYRFNTLTRKWDKPKVTGNVPHARWYHTAVVFRDEMLIYGGYGGYAHEVTNELHSLHLESFLWSTIETKGISPSLRYCHSATVHDDRCILIFGGFDYEERKIVNTILSFDVDNKTWTAVETRGTPPSSRSGQCAFVHNRRMYIFGGRDKNYSYFNDVFTFDAETFEWKEVTPNGEAPSTRSYAGCVTVNDQVFIFGGYNRNEYYLGDTDVLEM